ncbi:tyrosine-protein phosphatase non-receptor type substrate 1 isoform X2 [Hippoglossus hippoglossus]|uniref:tyrosine-protein phosphatase non-receptor type substrate 1 isoform X2 n=1 Tax=Hippoglossus hippoglossus TaxID=8267 RepID=UPI00148E2FBC|nr:tyrosine-protein phosphatase non-receptor type substrate 1 isoform X2 [Hippoglossus hippoglossus]
MKLLLSSLLLGSLCAISSRSASSTDIYVTQTPDVSVTEGDALNITCCFTSKSERMKINWRKHLTENGNQSSVINKWPQGSQMNHSCSTLTFSNITREDSGKYICNVTVEIPLYSMKEGNGTVITVKPRGSAENKDVPPARSDEVPIIIAAAVVGLLLLIALGCYCTLRIRHGTTQAVRVIYEVPHIDSEEADMDKHSTSSSRGSSQWCQVPVYESFDYFERVKNKESG